jgi:hypothetical protein
MHYNNIHNIYKIIFNKSNLKLLHKINNIPIPLNPINNNIHPFQLINPMNSIPYIDLNIFHYRHIFINIHLRLHNHNNHNHWINWYWIYHFRNFSNRKYCRFNQRLLIIKHIVTMIITFVENSNESKCNINVNNKYNTILYLSYSKHNRHIYIIFYITWIKKQLVNNNNN